LTTSCDAISYDHLWIFGSLYALDGKPLSATATTLLYSAISLQIGTGLLLLFCRPANGYMAHFNSSRNPSHTISNRQLSKIETKNGGTHKREEGRATTIVKVL
jgi:hypothetical protein